MTSISASLDLLYHHLLPYFLFLVSNFRLFQRYVVPNDTPTMLVVTNFVKMYCVFFKCECHIFPHCITRNLHPDIYSNGLNVHSGTET